VHSSTSCHSTSHLLTYKGCCQSPAYNRNKENFDKCLLFIFLQLERLENKIDNNESQEKNNALYRCVVRLEIKDCEFFCDGTGYGGDQNILQQGLCRLMGKSANTHKDWGLLNSRIWLAEINIDSSPLDVFHLNWHQTDFLLRWKSCKVKFFIQNYWLTAFFFQGRLKSLMRKKTKEDEQTVPNLSSAHQCFQAKYQLVQTTYIKQVFMFVM